MEIPASAGEIDCFYDSYTGDYFSSLHRAIAELTAENKRLLALIVLLLYKNECLRCGTDPDELGSSSDSPWAPSEGINRSP